MISDQLRNGLLAFRKERDWETQESLRDMQLIGVSLVDQSIKK
jgi:hypothetical protein